LIATWDGSTGIGARLAGPNDVAIAPDGSVYVSDEENHHIVHFDANGIVINGVGTFGTGPGQLIQPWGLVVDTAGNLYVADYGSSRVAVLAPDGAFLTEWGDLSSAAAQAFNPIYLTVNAAGEVFVSDEANNRILVVQPSLDGSAAIATPEATP
jgi:DNA-binding beta-propeller fold protein YncE